MQTEQIVPAMVVPPRRVIVHAREARDTVSIICRGWATASMMLADGRRQIISFLLPGEPVSTAYLFGAMYGRTVESITEVTYRAFALADVKSRVFDNPKLFDNISAKWLEERRQTEEALTDLGRRSAQERLARALLGLSRRLSRRGMVHDAVMEFPLRQRHLADATGLTSVHVCKLLGEFQRDGLIEVEERVLTIKDGARLSRVADMA